MSKHRPRPKAAPTFPSTNDFVVMGHGILDEPKNWWIGLVEWSDGVRFLATATARWARNEEPYIGDLASIIVYGDLAYCQRVLAAAQAARHHHIKPIRDANVALAAAKDALITDVRAAIAGCADV